MTSLAVCRADIVAAMSRLRSWRQPVAFIAGGAHDGRGDIASPARRDDELQAVRTASTRTVRSTPGLCHTVYAGAG
jgi:hypothetical protein